MKAHLKTRIAFDVDNLTDEEKQSWLSATAPRYVMCQHDPPLIQDGKKFSHSVVPYKLTPTMLFEQVGHGVLCQTEAEANETYDSLIRRNQKHLVVVQQPGYGTVGWVKNFRRKRNEIGTLLKNLPDGKQRWVAFEREMDVDTLGVQVTRREEFTTQEEAVTCAKGWQKQLQLGSQSTFSSLPASLSPPPPRRYTPLTKLEIEDLGRAKLTALRRQWPRCFALFERGKSNLACAIQDKEMEDAYLLDLVENRGDQILKSVKGGKVRADIQLINALAKAASNYAKRGKSEITDAAVYLIAFNWELGWCYCPDAVLARKLTHQLETLFTPGQVKKLRLRTLELVAKTSPGPQRKVE